MPLHNGCVEKIQGGLLNKSVKKPPIKTPAEKWEALINELKALALVEEFDEYLALMLISKIGGLNMIQPFDWNNWHAAYPEAEQVKLLDLETAVKHITRICRAERFYQNSIWGPIRSGLLMGLCLVVRELTDGGVAPNVMEKNI